VSDGDSPMPYLSTPERRILGPVVARLARPGSSRFERSVEENGSAATARMACVNALRIYAVCLFVLGVLARTAGVRVLALALYGVAVVAMAWSFWCLYTVVGPEREHRRSRETDEDSPGAARERLDALLRKLGREGAANDRAI
jgi:hypothetical protein